MERREDKSFGIIPIFKNTNNNFVFCIVRHAEGHWSFPKGHQNRGETEQETAIRELKEETGISNVNLLNNKSFFENYSFEKNNFKYNKSNKYFIGLVPSMATTTLNDFKKEIPELRWGTYEEAKKVITFPEAREVLDQAFKYLQTL